MAQFVLEAQQRTPGGKNANRRMRKEGQMPAVIYGSGNEAVPLSVDPSILSDILHSDSGHNTIFALNVDGKKSADVMVKDYQLDPVKGNLIHADFIKIAMDRLLQLSVDVEPVGEAAGVKNEGGIMDVVSRSIEVECLPADIPESIVVDVTALNINEYIRVKDLTQDPKVKILTDPDVVVVTVIPPVKEEEVPVEEPEEGAEPELIKRGKTEEEGEEKKPEEKTEST
jgi:large subunit ribosomal protein L25